MATILVSVLLIVGSIALAVWAARQTPSSERKRTLMGVIGSAHLGAGIVVSSLMPNSQIGYLIAVVLLFVAFFFLFGAIRVARSSP